MTVHRFPHKATFHPVQTFADGADDLRPCQAVIIAALFSLPFWMLICWVLA